MPDRLLIHLKYCLTPLHRVTNAAIVIREGRILAVGGFSAFTETSAYELVDLPDCYALPGFIDTRLYGAGGFDCMHADTDRNIAGMSKILACHGVTSFLPTTQSHEPQRLRTVVGALAEQCHEDLPGATPVAVHIEGPFINPRRSGAHPRQYIRGIDLDETRALIAAGAGRIAVFTFAPELPLALELTTLLREHHIIPCLGHTLAEEPDVRAAIAAGATRCSHLYNGMEPLLNRKLGLAAIALIDERLWVEFIADGVHCHPGMIDLACRCKPKDRLVGISNSMEAAGLASGIYRMGADEVLVTAEKATLADGTIAGSVSFLDDNYRRLLALSHLDRGDAAACFSLNAARSIGLDDRGEIKPGKRADLVVLDEKHEVVLTLVGGRIVYRRDAKPPAPTASPTALPA